MEAGKDFKGRVLSAQLALHNELGRFMTAKLAGVRLSRLCSYGFSYIHYSQRVAASYGQAHGLPKLVTD